MYRVKTKMQPVHSTLIANQLLILLSFPLKMIKINGFAQIERVINLYISVRVVGINKVMNVSSVILISGAF
jgi:hypothetical protein